MAKKFSTNQWLGIALIISAILVLTNIFNSGRIVAIIVAAIGIYELIK